MRVASRVVLSVGTVAAHILVSVEIAGGPSPARGVGTVPVVVATREVAEGDRYGPADLTVAHWPRGTVPRGAFTSIHEVAGRVAGATVFEGEAITSHRVARPEPRDASYPKITPGKRAMSFRIDEAAALSGLVQPNSRVDLLLVIDREEGAKAKVLMENLRVLGVGWLSPRWEDRRVSPGSIATIEVTPDEAERLAIGMTEGEFRLLVRPPDLDQPVTVGSVIEIPSPRTAIRTPRRDSAQVRVYRFTAVPR